MLMDFKMKQWTKLGFSLFLLSAVTACVNTQQINSEAAHSYAKVQREARSQGAVDNQSATAKRIHTVFNNMKPYAEKANRTGVPFAWEITVFKSPELNAWAMPGGKMAFYTGLVDKLALNDDEIAVVMGHEMAHALQEHSKMGRTVSAVTGLAAQLGKIALASQGISSNVLGVDAVDVLREFGLTKPFSRRQETEADEVGLFLMAESGYNPEAAPQVWGKMSKATKSTQDLLASLASTHPSNADRQANLARLVPTAKAVYLKKKSF